MFSVGSHSGGGRGTPSPSHNTSTGPMSFPGGGVLYLHPINNMMSFLGGTPVTGPRSRWGGGYPTLGQVRIGGLLPHLGVSPHPEMRYPQPGQDSGGGGGGTWNGVPPARSGWGYPEMGYPPSRDGVPPGQVRTGGGYFGWGTPPLPPRNRTVDRVLDTPRSVCLLSSPRRTFLFEYFCNLPFSQQRSIKDHGAHGEVF